MLVLKQNRFGSFLLFFFLFFEHRLGFNYPHTWLNYYASEKKAILS